GQQLSLSATEYLDVVYSWQGPLGFTANTRIANIPNAMPSNSGQYTLTASIPGCPSVIRTLNATVSPALSPTASSTSPVCQGQALYLNSSSHTGASYAWAGPNGFTATGNNAFIGTTHPVNHTGEYTLTVTQPGCGTASATTSVMIGG